MATDLLSAFNQYFELIHADNEALRREAYRLRYQVYVVETGFEHDADCACEIDENGEAIHLEKDEFDVRSDHYLVRHRRTGVYAATARLILPDIARLDAEYPIEIHCPDIQRVTGDERRARLGEISRFAVSKMFKRRIGEIGSLAGVSDNVDMYFEEDEKRVFPHISLGLIAAVIRMANDHRIAPLYAVMEPALLRLLHRFGVIFTRIGSDVEYHGTRVPCVTDLEECVANIQRAAPSVWELVTHRGEWMVRGDSHNIT